MSEHTPGPWMTATQKGGIWVVPTDPALEDIGLSICFMGGGLRVGISDANARLIAAAPDLLEALKAMNQAWMCNVEWHDWEASVKQAEAAIAKAEGRE